MPNMYLDSWGAIKQILYIPLLRGNNRQEIICSLIQYGKLYNIKREKTGAKLNVQCGHRSVKQANERFSKNEV